MTQEINQHPNKGKRSPVNQQSHTPASDSAVPAESTAVGLAHNSPVQNNHLHTIPNQSWAESATAEQAEDSPDLLRWRADALLDEMMMGGVDGSAASGTANQISSEYPVQNGQELNPESLGNIPVGMVDYGEGPAHDGRPYMDQSPIEPSPAQPTQPDSPNYPLPESIATAEPGIPLDTSAVGQVVTSETEHPPLQPNSPLPSNVSNVQPHVVTTDDLEPQSAPYISDSHISDSQHPTQLISQAPEHYDSYQTAPRANMPAPGEQNHQMAEQSPPHVYSSDQPSVGQGQPIRSYLRQPTATQLGTQPPIDASTTRAFQQPRVEGEHHTQTQPRMQPSGPPASPHPHVGQPQAGQPNAWEARPSFEQQFAPQPSGGYPNPGNPGSDYPGMATHQYLGQAQGHHSNQQPPLDPATYYAQQIAWRRELERKQWAISSGSSSDYLTSVPRYDEAQNRTASYLDRVGSQTSWQQNDGYNYGYSGDGYAPNGYGQGGTPSNTHGGIHANPNYSPQLGPVNPGYEVGQQPRAMPFAERMDVGVQARRHSNLLPRRSQMSVDALYEEMTVLQAQVDAALPIYGDSADRALHLLEKGRTILEQNPERSAEVAYYVQQVSGIIKRGQQRIEWSNLYRNRLSRYLTAWLFMGLLGIIGSLAYGDRVASTLTSFFPRASGFFANHMSAILLVIAASIIGTAVAALVNMWRHSQKEYGFFDRKYGLLGVILPLMGVIVGLVIYAVVAIAYLFLNVSPNTSWLAYLFPALLALIYGGSQEKIYGTSE